jgi:hypothetical protein
VSTSVILEAVSRQSKRLKRLPSAGAAEVNEVMRFSRIDRVGISPAQNRYEARTENVNTLPENSAFIVFFNTRTIKNRVGCLPGSLSSKYTASVHKFMIPNWANTICPDRIPPVGANGIRPLKTARQYNGLLPRTIIQIKPLRSLMKAIVTPQSLSKKSRSPSG